VRRLGESGGAAIEMTLAVTGLLLLIVSFGAGALWIHSQQVASDAAQSAVLVVAADGGTVAAGDAEARQQLSELTPRLGDPTIVGVKGDHQASVDIRAHTVRILGVSLPVHAHSTAPVERFRQAAQQP
jgi:Flp pilus assembly protein TadG